MPDPVTRAMRYQMHATECVKLASSASTDATRKEYESLTAGYLKLAEGEMRLAYAIATNNIQSSISSTRQ